MSGRRRTPATTDQAPATPELLPAAIARQITELAEYTAINAGGVLKTPAECERYFDRYLDLYCRQNTGNRADRRSLGLNQPKQRLRAR